MNGDPLGYVDPDGRNPVVAGAAWGAAVAAAANAYKQLKSCKPFDWGELAFTAAAGAVGGAYGGAIAKAGITGYAMIAANAGGSAAISAASAAINNRFRGGTNNVAEAAVRGLFSGAAGAAGGAAVSRGVRNYAITKNQGAYNLYPLKGSNAVEGSGKTNPIIATGNAIGEGFGAFLSNGI